MTWAVTADPHRFDEAVAWFRGRFPITDQLAVELGQYAGPRAWKIAGVAQLDIVQTVFDSLRRALETGVPFETWRNEVESLLTQAWGSSNTARIETIFRNASMSAYNAGRWRQMNEPAIRALRPFLFFDGIRDSRQSDICRPWDGTLRPVDDPVWQSAHPPMHHRCRSQLRSMTETEAFRRGLTPVLPAATADTGFGKTPSESDWQPDPGKYQPELFREFTQKRADIEAQVKRPKL